MDKRQWDKVLWITGVTLIILTLFIYILGIGEISSLPVYWVSFGFVIFSELVYTYILISLERDIIGVSRMVGGLIYVGITIALAIGFILIFPTSIKGYIFCNAVTVAMMLLSYILLGAARMAVNKGEEKIKVHRNTWEYYEAMVYTLAEDTRYIAYKAVLAKVYEALKYSDHASATNGAREVFEKVEGLEVVLKRQEKESIEDYIQELLNAIKAYNYKEKQSK